MKKLLIANWKMNPSSKAKARRLVKVSDFSNVVLASPFVFIETLRPILRRASLGAQNVSAEGQGAHTGEISVNQLKNLGVRYVIIGHSERRAVGETDLAINKKIKAVLGAHLKAVLCVGEPWSVRKRGLVAAKKFVKKQLQLDLNGIKRNNNLIIAYEPVWAISAVSGGKSDRPADALVMIKFIRQISGVKVLYGGSVSAKNAEAFLREKEISGALVGGASLRTSEFKKIVKISSRY